MVSMPTRTGDLGREAAAGGLDPSPMVIAAAAAPAAFITQFPATAINIALDRLGADLSASVSQLQWVVVAYALSFAMMLLSGGVLGDKIGARRVCLVGYTAFAVGSLVCAAAPGVLTLLVGRVGQGVGAALVLPGAISLIRSSSTGSKERFNRALALWSAVGAASYAAGPLAGGLLLAMIDWRSIFIICVVVSLVGVVLVRRQRSHGGVPTSSPELST